MQKINPITNSISSEYNSFPLPFLRNLQKIEHKYMLSKIITNFDKQNIDGIKEISTDDGSFEKVQDYYNSFLPDNKNYKINILNSIENGLLHYVAFDSIDEVLIYKIQSTSAQKIPSLTNKRIKNDPCYMKKIYNQSLQKPSGEKGRKLKLLTIRPIPSSNSIDGLLLLFSHGFYETNGSKKTTILFSCILDLKTSTLQIKYQSNNIKNLRSVYNTQMSDIIKEIHGIIHKKIPFIKILSNKDTTDYEGSIYDIFNELSLESEDIIKNVKSNKDESILLEEIQDFIHETLEVNKQQMGFDARSDELLNSYINRMVSIYYQNVAQKINENKTFQSYIYAFTFLSSESTRSSTSKGSNEAIYKDDIFWRLKDLIHSAKKIKALSVFERFNKDDSTKVYTIEELKVLSESITETTSKENIKLINNTLHIDYKIEAVHGGIKIHYNNNSNANRRFERGVKNDYVIGKIIKYL